MAGLAKVTVAEAARSVAGAPEKTRLELVAPFVEASARVLGQECGQTVQKGKVYRVQSPQTSAQISALIAVTGGVTGLVVYSMSRATALGLASKMMGEALDDLDEIGQSAIAELANVITGQAGSMLESQGFSSDMSPPVLLVGSGSSIATFNLTRLVVPLVMEAGDFNVDLAIKEV
jgi:chemotaxis protein CheX